MFPRVALIAVSGAALLTSAAFAQVKEPAASASDGAAPRQSCEHRKFETRIATEVDGKLRSQTVTICGIPNQTDAAWKRTLEDAAAKVEANEKMSPSVKQQILTALKVEITRLDMAKSGLASGSTTQIPGLLNAPKTATIAPATPTRPAPAPVRPLERDYGNLKPLPPPLPPAAAAATATATYLPSLPSPRIKVLCSTQYDPRGTEECDDLYPSTIITIRADEALAGDTSLRFLRKGDERGDVTLAALQKGQMMRVPLPRGVCTGVTRGTVEIQVMRKAPTGAKQVVDALGPYDLRC